MFWQYLVIAIMIMVMMIDDYSDDHLLLQVSTITISFSHPDHWLQEKNVLYSVFASAPLGHLFGYLLISACPSRPHKLFSLTEFSFFHCGCVCPAV